MYTDSRAWSPRRLPSRINQQICFNRKSISRNSTHPQSYSLKRCLGVKCWWAFASVLQHSTHKDCLQIWGLWRCVELREIDFLLKQIAGWFDSVALPRVIVEHGYVQLWISAELLKQSMTGWFLESLAANLELLIIEFKNNDSSAQCGWLAMSR